MEKIKGDIITKAQYIQDRIEKELVLVCDQWEIEDLKSECQSVWKAVLQEIGERLFMGDLAGILKDKNLILHDNDIMRGNDNKYDYDLLLTLADYYIKLSNRYKKLNSIIAFCNLFHISQFTVDKWGALEAPETIDIYNNTDIDNYSYSIEILNYKRLQIYKKIKQGRLDNVLDKSYDSNNVMGAMYVGNSEFGLNLPGVRENKPAGRQLIQRETVQEISAASNPALPKIDES